jgi:glycerophosphoryl diester phosphodiesterase
LWIAHRGAGTLAPENTLAAFRLGAQHGYRCFECDVKLSADGVPFLLHDATLERTTNGQGLAGDRPWSELSQLDAGAGTAAPTPARPLPTLAAFARWLRRNGLLLDLEIKPTPGHDEATGRSRGAGGAQPVGRCGGAAAAQLVQPPGAAGGAGGAPELPRALLLDELWTGWEGVATALQTAWP